MANAFFEAQRPHDGLTYEQYLAHMEAATTVDDALLDELELRRKGYTVLNLHRTRRIHRTFKGEPALQAAVAAVAEPQLWMVVTEPWCGDSAQTVPYIAELAKANPLIELRILLRDDHPDLIDHYQTAGTRSIPKLVAFDSEGNERFQWGPRPKEAARLFKAERNRGTPHPEILEKLHLWYGRDRGKTLQAEFLHLLTRLSTPIPLPDRRKKITLWREKLP